MDFKSFEKANDFEKESLDSLLDSPESELNDKEIGEILEKTPEAKREEIGLGLRNAGFFVEEWKSGKVADICEKTVAWLGRPGEGPIEEQGTVNRFFVSMAATYRKDEAEARKKIEEREVSGDIRKRISNVGQLSGNILKYGRTVADVIGWTAGSPLRYVMLGAQFFSRGAEAAKDARLKNQEVIEKTRIKDVDKAAEEAWEIYELAQTETWKKSEEKVSKENLEKAYLEKLPADLLERLKKSESGTAMGILSKLGQFILKKDVEFAIKHGKFSEASFQKRIKELDGIVGQYGTVDALAIGARYMETAGKAVITGVQLETAYLLIKNLPEIVEKVSGLFESSTVTENIPLGVKVVAPAPIVESVPVDTSEPVPLETEFISKETSEQAPEFLSGPEEMEGIAPESVEPVSAEKEKLFEQLATIKKGDGIENVLIRQLEADPAKMGCDEEIISKGEDAIHRWAQGEAHRIALKVGYVKLDPETGKFVETRVFLNEKNPTRFCLEFDKDENKYLVEEQDTKTYQWAASEKESIGEEKTSERIKGGGEQSVKESLSKTPEEIEEEVSKHIQSKGEIEEESASENIQTGESEEKISDYIKTVDKPEENAADYMVSGEEKKVSDYIETGGQSKEKIIESIISEANPSSLKLIEQIKTGKLTVEEFGNYYAAKDNTEEVSANLMINLKNIFKEAQSLDPEKSGKALATINLMLKKLKHG